MRWELFSSEDKDFVLAEALNRGWKEKVVQVKHYKTNTKDVWAIEPYEKDCSCKNLVSFEDFIEGKV